MTSAQKKIIACFMYVAGLTAVFLIVLFPEDAVRPFIENNIKRAAPGITLEIGELGPSLLPPGIRMRDMGVFYQDQLMVKPDDARFSPAIFSLLRGKPGFGFKIELFEGVVRGKCRLKGMSDQGMTQGTVEGRMAGVNLATIDAIKGLVSYPLAGELQGTLTGSKNGPAYTYASELTINEAAVNFAPPVFGLDRLAFEKIEAGLKGDARTVTVDLLKAKGSQVEAEFTGDIRLRRPYEASVLDLEGFIKPQSAFISQLRKVLPVDLLVRTNPGKKGFPVRIDGTIADPGISMQ